MTGVYGISRPRPSVNAYPEGGGVNKSRFNFSTGKVFFRPARSEYALCGFWMDCNGCNFIWKFFATDQNFTTSQCLGASEVQLQCINYSIEQWPLFSKKLANMIFYQQWSQGLFGVTWFEIWLSRARPIGLIERQKAWWGSQTSCLNWTMIVHCLFVAFECFLSDKSFELHNDSALFVCLFFPTIMHAFYVGLVIKS